MEPHEPLAGCLSQLKFPGKPMRDGDELQGAHRGGSWGSPCGREGRVGEGERRGEGGGEVEVEGAGSDKKAKPSCDAVSPGVWELAGLSHNAARGLGLWVPKW